MAEVDVVRGKQGKDVPTSGSTGHEGKAIRQPITPGGVGQSPKLTGPNRKRLAMIEKDLLGPGDTIGSGDSEIILDALSCVASTEFFEELKKEIDWQKMYHRSGEVPRLVAVQGEVGEDGEVPIYRHPADESPPLRPFTDHVDTIRREVERILKQSFNHVLIQLYREGNDNISEHSDKTLDLIRNSRIINVSLGAQRYMTLRSKKSSVRGTTEDTSPRQTQRIQMPHNSIFVLGPRSNAQWLHGIRADKRPASEKSDAEQAFNGARVSLTFRQIGTFYDIRKGLIWGSGATIKTKEAAHHVSTDPDQVEEMLMAFGSENHETDFDWDKGYGRGFDVIDLVIQPVQLAVSTDPVANLRARLGLSYKQVAHTLSTLEGTMNLPQARTANTAVHLLSNLESPELRLAEGKVVRGDVAILTFLETRYPTREMDGFTDEQLHKCTSQADDLLYLWRECEDKTPAPYTRRFELERAMKAFEPALDELQSSLQGWENYFAENSLTFVAGHVFTILDCAFWPVIDHIVERWTDFVPSRFPRLIKYREEGSSRVVDLIGKQ